MLHAIDTGDGPRTAVLLHGLMGSGESWHRVIPLLADHGYRVLKRQRVRKDSVFDEMADAARSFIDRHGSRAA